MAAEYPTLPNPDAPGSGGDFVNDTYGWIRGFTKSAVESIPELVGITPSTETREFRQDNPISGFASEMAGMAVPYTGWLKAANAIPKFAKAISAIGDIQKAPIRTGFLQSVAQIAPFEAGRVAISQLPGVGDKGLGEMLGEATLNTVLAGGVGGLIHGIAAAGTRDAKLGTVFPGLDIAAPLTLQARKMREIIDGGTLTGDSLDKANSLLFKTLNAARTEVLPSDARYVGGIARDFVPGADTSGLEGQLNRLFRVRDNDPGRVLYSRAFAQGVERNFPSSTAWKDAAKQAGLEPGFEEYGQYFREISFNDKKPASTVKVAQAIDDKLTKNMESADANTFISREGDDGMFVLARKVEGAAGTGSDKDKWVLWKTDQPGHFLPDADKWAKAYIGAHKWLPGADLSTDGGPIYNALRNFTNQMPLRNYMAIGANPSKVGEAIKALLPQNLVGTSSEAFARTGEALKEYLAPRIQQFKQSWRANWLVNAMKLGYDNAETMTQKLLNGEIKIDSGKNLMAAGLSGEREGALGFTPIRDAVMAVPEEDFQNKFWKIWRERMTPDTVTQERLKGHTTDNDHLFDPTVNGTANELNRVDEYVQNILNKAEDAVGRSPSTRLPGSYGLGRVWEGDARFLIRNESDEIVGVASGPTRKSARANAEALIKENPNWKIDTEYSVSQGNLPPEVRPLIQAPSFLLEQQGLRGFLYDTKPFTRNEFLDLIENQLRGRMKYQANLSADDILSTGFERLQREDPAAYRMALARRDDYAGVPSKFAKWQNQVTDAVLAPILGPNSATKVVEATNTAMFNLQLGALKLSFPLTNALTFIQNVLPETAFILGKAPPDRLAQYYSFFAAGGTKGPVGGMGVLNPIKLFGQSMKEMGRPSKDLTDAFGRAVNDRVIDPRMVEEYVGEAGTKVTELRKAFTSGGNFASWVRAVSEVLPAQSERLARSQAFTNGFIIARDFLKSPEGNPLSKDAMYNFARQFTENTMYLYSSADKPRIFTTPAGSMLGLFKNWMFHFMGAMGEYAKEGFVHNNWSPLLWQTTGTFAMGGLAATPAWWAADQFSRAWDKKGALETAYDKFGSGADGLLYGLPAAMTGMSLYSNVNTPMANPVRDATQLFNVVAFDRAKQIGKLAGTAFDAWQATGEHPGHDLNTRELLIRAFAPTTVYRSFAGMSEPGTIIQMGTHRPQLKDQPAMNRVFYALGFNPVELDRASAISQELYTKHEDMKKSIQKLGNAWADAEGGGDSESMGLILRQATVWGVDVGKVVGEGMKELTKRRMDIVERTMRPADIPFFRAALETHREQAAARQTLDEK